MFGIDIPALSRDREATPPAIDTSILLAVGANPEAQLVLADFTNAMRFPVGTGFYCYRAIEAMMQFVKDTDDENDKVAWPKLRERLRVSREAIDAVKAHADLPRHGKPSAMTDSERVLVFKIADEMTRRFLVYLQRNDQKPLGGWRVQRAGPKPEQ
ncbi:hypothetical protein Q3C01_17095 [Bradyrhizobium sp. UFLA05-109]